MRGDIGPRIRLAGLSADAEGTTDTGPVDLFQELKWIETQAAKSLTEKMRNYRK